MELFRAPGRPGIVVDYAHNAGALRAALEALRARLPRRRSGASSAPAATATAASGR
ncbi:MAG: cyanophycin synthetase [Halofilum sp. (in: g-proteobacteria)]|nr:cyanophycin synthetase [Halofilum sp. (in: g-proteobacteria)]